MAGRPTDYNSELIGELCQRLAMGRSMRSVCKDEDMPAMATVFRWLGEPDKTEFKEQYARAKEEAADALAEELLDISDTPLLGEVRTTKQTPDGDVIEEVRQEEMLGHRRLQIDTRKWLMAKMKPKRYGDKIDMTTNGKDLPSPIIDLTKRDSD